MKYKKIVAVISIVLVLCVAAFIFFQSASVDTSKPTEFNADSAMLAIFGTYNFKEKGVLLPEEFTKSWDLEQAKELVTPIVTAIFNEGGKRKAVIAMQRQEVSEYTAEYNNNQTGTTVSVYVFGFDGKQWIFEKGKKIVAVAGAHGSAPAGKLIHLGPDKFGLLFEWGNAIQGHTLDNVFIVVLSDSKVFDALDLDMSEDNNGDCTEDKNWIKGHDLTRCWSWSSKLTFLKQKDAAYYTLKLTTTNDTYDDDEKPIHTIEDTFYVHTATGYKLTKDKNRMFAGITVPEKQIYDVSDSQSSSQAMSEDSRKLLQK